MKDKIKDELLNYLSEQGFGKDEIGVALLSGIVDYIDQLTKEQPITGICKGDYFKNNSCSKYTGDCTKNLCDYYISTKEQPTDEDEFYIDCSALTIPEQAQLRMLFSTGKIKITPIHKQLSVDLKWTGLRDKNGVCINEGDKLKHNEHIFYVKWSTSLHTLILKEVGSTTNWRSLDWCKNVKRYITVL